MKNLNFKYLIPVILVFVSCQKEPLDSMPVSEATKENSTTLKMGFTSNKKTLKTKKLDPKGSLSPRYNHRCLAFENKIWILGGNLLEAGDYDNYTSDDVLFSTDGAHWKSVSEQANFPNRSLFGATVFQDKMWITGGIVKKEPSNTTDLKNDVWSSEDGIEWKLVTPKAPFPQRFEHTLTAFNGSLWLIGGVGFNEKTNMYDTLADIWRSSDGVNWIKVTDKASFGPRRWHASVVHDGKLWVVGGGDTSALKDVWYTENGSQWIQATDNYPFSARVFHTVESDGKLMWLIAGYIGLNGHQNDIWYSSDGVTWYQAETSQTFPKRAQHASVFVNGKLWVINGTAPSNINGPYNVHSDVWSFEDPAYTQGKTQDLSYEN
ncbi:hypothetical protein FK220_013175 [Flavobacteriaceae bacterium TP-CH-4]|uniref:Galactose oxidase n=1 Tax=Pelagihabitans pacificus TaxID=2696054 RepID=A0A967ATW7_9FLAO|nr:hypothetical protein [Pelagihabitans pacificus]NHF60299.1 hypothetical protein [Pelagihabitans pacificus]